MSNYRILRFRAWTGKRMLYQDKQYLASFIRRIVPEIILDHGGEHFSQHESYLPNGGVIDEYLMQFTGLVDKNGKEIYGCDIIKADWHWTEPHVFDFPNDFYWIQEVSLEAENLEVLGNVYEHPDLLPK